MINANDILRNAIDSLIEALSKLQTAREGNDRDHKFAILHIAHFLELIFKHYIASRHPLLIYKNPFSKKIEEENTIGLWEAIQFLKNEGKPLDNDLLKDLEWLKKVRNGIEHAHIEYSIHDARQVMGRIIHSFYRFNEMHGIVDFKQIMNSSNYAALQEYTDDYKHKLNSAKDEVKALWDRAHEGLRMKEWGEANWHESTCPECDHETFVTDTNSATGFRCTFCGNTDSDEIPERCSLCQVEWPRWEMSGDLTPDENGEKHYICPNCIDHARRD